MFPLVMNGGPGAALPSLGRLNTAERCLRKFAGSHRTASSAAGNYPAVHGSDIVPALLAPTTAGTGGRVQRDGLSVAPLPNLIKNTKLG
jgi:hypothetical protein